MTKQNTYKLTNPQKNIYQVEQQLSNSAINHIASYIKFSEVLDASVLSKTLNKLIKANDSFRLVFEQESDNLVQYFKPYSYVEIPIKILENENIWLTQEQISKLYNKAKSTISEHIKNIYLECELSETNTMRKFGISEFSTKPTNYYNLEMIIAIGFRVKSSQGTKFRIWANEKIKEYLVKGYNLNVERFKNNGNDPYFDELLDKIRDIRSSEKVFWRKILDIYATSIDYNPKKEITINFFKTIQNKVHYAVSNNTAAEIVYNRVDSNKNNIGLTNFKGDMPTRKETEIAKNYLTYEE